MKPRGELRSSYPVTLKFWKEQKAANKFAHSDVEDEAGTELIWKASDEGLKRGRGIRNETRIPSILRFRPDVFILIHDNRHSLPYTRRSGLPAFRKTRSINREICWSWSCQIIWWLKIPIYRRGIGIFQNACHLKRKLKFLISMWEMSPISMTQDTDTDTASTGCIMYEGKIP